MGMFYFYHKINNNPSYFFLCFLGLAHDFAFSHIYKQQACSTIFCALSNFVNEVKRPKKTPRCITNKNG